MGDEIVEKRGEQGVHGSSSSCPSYKDEEEVVTADSGADSSDYFPVVDSGSDVPASIEC